jgi:cell division septation protein DedD
MLGVRPVGDPGMPTMLALAVPSPTDTPVALAAASPFAPTPGAAQIPAFQLAALSPRTIAPSVPVPLDAPAAITATPADAPASAVMLAAQNDAAAARPAAPATPLLLRVSTPAAPPFLLRAPRSALRKALLTIQPQTALRRSGYVVQLGAFRRAGAIQAAWARAAKLMPRLASFSPVHAEFSASGGALVRLSVGGFETRDDATRLCTQIHARGGQCFVREIAGDAPVQWVRSETGQRAG